MKPIFTLLLLMGLFLLNSCSSKDVKKNTFATPEIHPAPRAITENERVIAIATLNDINGQMNGIESQGIKIGGLNLIETYLKILKKNYPDNLLTLSTGHFLPHTATEDLAKTVISRLSVLPIDYFGVSYREIETLTNLSEQNNAPKAARFLNSNIFKIQTGKLIERAPILPSAVQRINGVNIGLISVAPAHDKKIINGVYFQDPVPAILKTRNELMKKNADIIVLLTHSNSECQTEEADDLKKAKFICEDDLGLSLLIKRLPPNSVDIVVTTGERFSYGRHDSGIYVLNTPGNGLYLGHLQLVFDVETKTINHQKSAIFVPTLLCQDFFELTQDCFIGENSKRIQALQKSGFEKSEAIFFGEKLSP